MITWIDQNYAMLCVSMEAINAKSDRVIYNGSKANMRINKTLENDSSLIGNKNVWNSKSIICIQMYMYIPVHNQDTFNIIITTLFLLETKQFFFFSKPNCKYR